MGIWLFRSSNAAERRVKDFLGDSTLKLEHAEKIAGGREPMYAAAVPYDSSRAHLFCESLGLFELQGISEISDRNVIGKMSAIFGKDLVIQPNAAFYNGTQ